MALPFLAAVFERCLSHRDKHPRFFSLLASLTPRFRLNLPPCSTSASKLPPKDRIFNLTPSIKNFRHPVTCPSFPYSMGCTPVIAQNSILWREFCAARRLHALTWPKPWGTATRRAHPLPLLCISKPALMESPPSRPRLAMSSCSETLISYQKAPRAARRAAAGRLESFFATAYQAPERSLRA